MAKLDYSFLRFEQSLDEAKKLGNQKVADIFFHNQVHLIPNEFYRQITNTKFGISLANDYLVYIVDKCDNILDDVTNLFLFNEFQNQICFEFMLIKDYGLDEIFIRIDHTESFAKYYSAPFICTEMFCEQTSSLWYKSFDCHFGTNYPDAGISQRIRLKIYYDFQINKTESEEYRQILTGNTISGKAKYSVAKNYKFNEVCDFVLYRTNIALISDVVYIDGVRVTNKPQFVNEERVGDVNYYNSSAEVFFDECDTIDDNKPELFTEPNYIILEPFGKYTNDNKPTDLILVFNYDIVDYSNAIIELRKYDDNSLVYTYNAYNLSVTDSEVGGNLPSLDNNTKYYFTINNGFITTFGQYQGFTNKDIWWFRLKGADYSDTDYSSDYEV